MHVPYSMDDSEPDLGGFMPGSNIDYVEETTLDTSLTRARYYSQTEHDHAIKQLISQHQKTVDQYRQEIIDLNNHIDHLRFVIRRGY